MRWSRTGVIIESATITFGGGGGGTKFVSKKIFLSPLTTIRTDTFRRETCHVATKWLPMDNFVALRCVALCWLLRLGKKSEKHILASLNVKNLKICQNLSICRGGDRFFWHLGRHW